MIDFAVEKYWLGCKASAWWKRWRLLIHFLADCTIWLLVILMLAGIVLTIMAAFGPEYGSRLR